MARLALVVRAIGRKTYQTVTLASLRRTAGFADSHRHTINVYVIFTPTRLVGLPELHGMEEEAKLCFSDVVTVTGEQADINRSAGVAMAYLQKLAERNEHDLFGYSEFDVLFNPDWLDRLLELGESPARFARNAYRADDPILPGVAPASPLCPGIGCPIDMPMGWYEPVEHDTWWEKKWMAAQCYVMNRDAALHIQLDDPIFRQPGCGWDKEMPSRLTEQGFVHFTPKGQSWAQHIGFYGVTANGNWPLGVGFMPDERVNDLWLQAYAVTRKEVAEEYER